MTEPATDLTPSQAQELMSRLLDGELSPDNATQLYTYLAAHPEDMDWMESIDALREASAATPAIDSHLVAQRVLSDIEKAQTPSTSNSGALLKFPKTLRPLAAAAAIALIGIVSWPSFQQKTTDEEGEFHALQGSEIEFVSTDIPDASTIVYTNDETGWTVVWVEQMDPIPEEV